MFRLLAIEWLKLRHYRPFWVLVILFMGLLFLTNYFTSHHFFLKTKFDVSLVTKGYSFPDVWDYIGFWVRVLGGLISVFIIISTTNEFQYRTHRQNVIDGWSRSEYFHAKWLLCVVVAVAVTLYGTLLGASFGLVYDPHPVAYNQHLERLLYIFLLVLNYTALAMTLSFFVKRGALSVILFLAFCYALEPITASILNWRTGFRLGDYLPLQASAGLLPFPITDLVRKQMPVPKAATNAALAIISSCWLVFYYLVGWWKLRRSDW
jgi:ABC-2 type transport system permease protein